MAGYIGERAKRRRRKLIIFFILILVVIFFYYFLPLLKSSDIKPTDNILPSEKEITSPEMSIDVEELELKVFDKEQKILFRNKQINKLKEKIRILTFDNETLLKSVGDLNDTAANLSIENHDKIIKKIKKSYLNEIKKLKNIIIKLNNEKKEISKNKNDLIDKEFKIIFSKNLKLNNLNEENNKKINVLENLIEEQNLIIQLLKDKSPHG